MASPRFAESESGSTALSHHEALATTAGWEQHENGRSDFITRVAQAFVYHRRILLLLVAILSWSSLIIPIAASELHGDRSAPSLVADDLAWKGSPLLLDQRPPPIVPLSMPPYPINQDASEQIQAPPSKRAISTDPKNGTTGIALPQAFDTGLSNNFTSTCGSFLTRLRTNEAFKNCHPFSLLLQTSSGFFDASKSPFRITSVLDASCSVSSPTQCKSLLDNYARELLSATACKTDYANDNPIVLQAYNGLVAYQPAYLASCTRDSDGAYCYTSAVLNSTAGKDSLPYYLPVGQELPGGSRLTCNKCLQQVMSAYAPFSNNVTQPLSKTYTSAAQQISIACGKTFVNVTAAPLKGAATVTSPSFTPTIALFLTILFYIFY